MLAPEAAVAVPSSNAINNGGLFSLASNLISNSLTDSTRPALCIPAISCSLERIPNLDTCCINSPSGHFLSTQFWDPQPAVGANDTWTVHGLWPDYCNGGFDAFCNSTRSLSGNDIRKIIADADANGTHPGLYDYMNEYWGSSYNDASSLWSHEWNKHGTCISTLEQACYDRDQQKPNAPEVIDSVDVLDYFTHASMLFSTLPTFQFFADHGIVPSYDKTYSLEQFQNAIRASSHGNEATIHCRNHNEISEIWYHFNVRGSLRNAMDNWWNGDMFSSWISTVPDGQRCRCPAEGIRYLPKGEAKDPVPSPTYTATQTAEPTTTGTGAPTPPRPFVGRGRLMVRVLSSHDSEGVIDGSVLQPVVSDQRSLLTSPIPQPYTGCLIRHGTWYAANSLSSCAIFTADDDVKSSKNDDDTRYHLFTLASRYAPCSFVPDPSNTAASFTCSPKLGFQTILSNNATVDEQHTEDARRLTVGKEHRSLFWAERAPRKNEEQDIWVNLDEDRYNEEGKGVEMEEKVEVEIYWLAA